MIIRWMSVMFLILVLFSSAGAASSAISDVWFEDQGETIVIHYNLTGDNNQKYQVTISLADAQNHDYTITSKSVNGDIGKDVEPGMDKTIVWNMTQDYPSGLEGEGFVFTVDAVPQKKSSKTWMYVVGGAAAVTGVTVVLLGGKEKKKDKGSISINIPAEY